jgi:hypothetical protein
MPTNKRKTTPPADWGKKPAAQTAASPLDQFVAGGGEGKARLNAIIPVDLHSRFKATVALKGRKEMTSVLIELIEEYCSRP